MNQFLRKGKKSNFDRSQKCKDFFANKSFCKFVSINKNVVTTLKVLLEKLKTCRYILYSFCFVLFNKMIYEIVRNQN